MKKMLLIMLLCYTRLAGAQGFNFGLSGGDMEYIFSNPGVINYNHSTLSLGVCVQYVFKDSLFGIEGDALLYVNPPIYGSRATAFAPYFFVNPFKTKHVSFEIRAGVLGCHSFDTETPPVNDIGPSAGLYVYCVFRHMPETGIDFTFFHGFENYNLIEYPIPPGFATAIPPITFNTKLITLNLSLKIMVP